MSRTSTLLTIVASSIVVGILLFGCGGPPSTEIGGETKPQVKIPVEAYLFDVSILRRGKPTSLRLDVFDADSVLALGGRAYLGKGALRARLTRDSLIAYFPTSDEYLSEDFASFSFSGKNPINLSNLGFLSLLKHPPDTGAVDDSIRVDFTQISPGDSRWIVHSGTLDSVASLKWRLHLTYALADGNIRLRQFSYFDSTMTITANRREYRAHARVPANRFQVTIPSTATPVNP